MVSKLFIQYDAIHSSNKENTQLETIISSVLQSLVLVLLLFLLHVNDQKTESNLQDEFIFADDTTLLYLIAGCNF